MLGNLAQHARGTWIIVLETARTKKLSFANHWAVTSTSEFAFFCELVNRSQTENRKAILVADDQEASRVFSFLSQRSQMPTHAHLGVLVLASDPKSFLEAHYGELQLLDVLAEKDAKKDLEAILLRTLRNLLRSMDGGPAPLSQATLEKLNEIFIALSAERDPQKLLATILIQALTLTGAARGVLYMLEEKDGEMLFRLRVTNSSDQDISYEPMNQKVSENSLCGFVALTGKTHHMPFGHESRTLAVPQHNRNLDLSSSQAPLNLLTLPLKNGRNDILAILQIGNKKLTDSALESKSVTAFTKQDESLLASFATQAAICLENVDLYADIRRLFEGFIKASVTAIESRDPSTAGHSERVAKICVGLARATNDIESGVYRSVRFKEEEIRELEYAALLHDFGKIGVREEVLVKAKKLYPYQLESIRERIKIFKAAAKISYLERRLNQSISESQLEREYLQKIKEIENHWETILHINEPTILMSENKAALEVIRNEQLILPDGTFVGVLTEEEYRALSITQGSLTDSERLEIESHVRHTYQFLKMIPWTRDFKHLPEIAFCHHEKLDGSGYPRGLTSHEIPLQSKIMTIADIYDALTASDRWYKESVPTQRALDIMSHEVAKGQLDPVLFDMFVEKKIYQLTQTKVLTNVA